MRDRGEAVVGGAASGPPGSGLYHLSLCGSLDSVQSSAPRRPQRVKSAVVCGGGSWVGEGRVEEPHKEK